MKNLYLFIIFFFTLNCSINKVSNLHGFRFIDTKLEKIELNRSNKNDVRTIIGHHHLRVHLILGFILREKKLINHYLNWVKKYFKK